MTGEAGEPGTPVEATEYWPRAPKAAVASTKPCTAPLASTRKSLTVMLSWAPVPTLEPATYSPVRPPPRVRSRLALLTVPAAAPEAARARATPAAICFLLLTSLSPLWIHAPPEAVPLDTGYPEGRRSHGKTRTKGATAGTRPCPTRNMLFFSGRPRRKTTGDPRAPALPWCASRPRAPWRCMGPRPEAREAAALPRGSEGQGQAQAEELAPVVAQGGALEADGHPHVLGAEDEPRGEVGVVLLVAVAQE